jgi:hypothetical protein
MLIECANKGIQEIGEELKALAEQKKNDGQSRLPDDA